jgi:hypothetical protein
VLGRVPGIGELVGAVSPPVRYVIVPLAAAVFGTQAAPDGRVAHRFAADWLRLRLRPRRRSAGRRVPLEAERVPWTGTVATVWDEHAPQLHQARVTGPARVTFNRPVTLADGRGGVMVARPAGDGEARNAVVLGAGRELEVRS